MSSGVPGNKDKGFKLSSENNTSFVKNVTSRVSGLIPSTITKWFSSPSSSNANGSVPTADSTDSSTEDEAIESSVTQPPAKRMRFNPPGKSSHYTPTITKCSSTNTESLEPFNVVLSPPGRNTFRKETNYVSTPIPSRNEEPQTTGNESSISVYNLCGSASTINNSIDRKRKSLFVKSTNDVIKSSENPSVSTVKEQSQPYFKPCLSGSPFYPGRTMYGGAASSYMNQPNIKHRKDTLVNKSSNNDAMTMSHSARRVMDLLENYSSPLVEAKRIPQYIGSPKNNSLNSSIKSSTLNRKSFSYKTQELHVPQIATILRLKQKSRLMDTTNVARQIIASHSSSSEFFPYPKGESHSLNESGEKMTTKIKTRLTRNNRGGQESPLANKISLPEATLQIDRDNLPQFSFGGPGSSSKITNFTIINTVSQGPQTDNKTAQLLKSSPEKDSSKPNETSSNDQFYTFSSPVRISTETSFVTNTPQIYTFGSPERTLEKGSVNVTTEKKNNSENIFPVSSVSCLNEAFNENPVKPNCNDCSVESSKENNDSKKCCVCNVFSRNKIDDKCEDCNKKTNNVEKLSAKMFSDATEWRCGDCWVNNEASLNKCVCCGSKKPKKGSGDKKVETSDDPVIFIIKELTDPNQWKCSFCCVNNDRENEKCICCYKIHSEVQEKQNNFSTIKDKQNNKSEWKCDDCWITNKITDDKCAACGGGRPGSKINKSLGSVITQDTNFASTNTTESSAPLKKIMKSQTDMWECPICLVRNENNRSKCVCCEAEKPGSKKELEKKAFSFGTTPSVAFKFGIDPKASITKASDKVVTEENDLLKESETNNNVLPKVTSFTFGIPAKKQELKNSIEEDKKQQEPPNMAFSFVLPKQNPVGGDQSKGLLKANTFSLIPKPTEDTGNMTLGKGDKESNAPNIDIFSSNFPEIPKVPSNLFVTPLSTQFGDKKTTDSTATSNISANLKNAETSITLIPQVTSVKSTVTQSNFALVPTMNMFSNSISTASPKTSFTTQQSTSPGISNSFEQNNSNPISQFKKIESTPASMLFNQNNNLISTTTQSSLTPAAPIFSFGNSQQSAVTQVDKQQFSFKFGSNKTETNLFKNTFATTTDGSINTHKFTLPVSSSLGSSGSQTGTTLENSSVIPAGNAASNSVLSGTNSLASTGSAVGSDLPSNTINSGNSLSTSATLPVVAATGIFNTPVPKENIWSANNNTSTNLFVSNANTLQKPATFTFGASTTFNASTPNSAFGTTGTPVPAAQNVFTMTKQNNNSQPLPSLFSNTIQSPPASSNMFGAPSLANNSSSTMGMFGSPNVGGSSAFGTSNPPIPGFEAPAIAQAPAFNFGSQQSTPVFGFSQQQQQQQQHQQQQQPPSQPQPGGLYSFGAAAGNNSPQVQFNMGSTPNNIVRRVRKAIRRTTQR